MKWLRDLVKAGGSISSPFNHYQVQKILGSGCFGTVALCTKNNTDQKVALKVVKDPDHEGNFMRYLSKSGSASHHIVQWFCSFDFNAHFCHELEVLDIGLDDFLEKSSTLPLHHIRPIITQMADALNFLKSLKIIHGDLKLENIMLVDHVRKPLQVKLIDFGLARPTHLATQGTCFGALCYSALEMAIGAPLHHALDMWALGCIAAELFLGQVLFSGKKTADLVEVIVQILGLPPREVLDSALLTQKYFCRPDGQNWVHKLSCVPWRMKRPVPIETLDDMYTRNPQGGEDLYLFVDLVKRMLDLDPGSRIDPQEVMAHPFTNPSLSAHVEAPKPHLESQSSVSPFLSKPRGQKRKREDEDEEEDVVKRPDKRYRRKDQASVISSQASSGSPGCFRPVHNSVPGPVPFQAPLVPGSSATDTKSNLESQSSVSTFPSNPRGQKRKREDEDEEDDVVKRPDKRYRQKDQASVISSQASSGSPGCFRPVHNSVPGPVPFQAPLVPGSSATDTKSNLESEHIQLPSSLPDTPAVSRTRGLKRKREEWKEGEERPDKRYRGADLV